MTIAANENIEFRDNEYGILSNHTDVAGAHLSVTGADFSTNDRGIVTHYTNVDISDCTFGGQRLGVYLQHNPSATIRRCTFNGNPDDPAECDFGLYALSADLEIRDNRFENSRYGIYIRNSTDHPPQLTGNVSKNHTAVAFYLRDGNWTYTDADRNVFENTPRGVMAHTVNWLVKDVVTADNCDYPIMDYYGNCQLRNVTTRGKTSGLYSYQSESIDAQNLTASDSQSYGVRVYDCVSAKFDRCQLSGNAHGMYLRSDQNIDPQLTNCQFLNNIGYGLLLQDATLRTDANLNLTFADNQYGLRVIRRPLVINAGMQVHATGNRYAFMVYQNDLRIKDLELTGNEIGVYCNNGAVDVDNCRIDASSRGIIAYLNGNCGIRSSQIDNADYGIILRALVPIENPPMLSNVTVTEADLCGIYTIGDPSSHTTFRLQNCDVNQSRRGYNFRSSTTICDQIRCSDLTNVGVYQSSGTLQLTRGTFARIPNSWAILARGDRCNVSQSVVTDAKYGIATLSAEGAITNSVVSGVRYGIYLRGSSSRFNVTHNTVANCSHIGLARLDGASVVRNNIFQSLRYGIYDGRGSGMFDHRHNLVSANYRAFQNTSAGEGEITDPAEFLAPEQGDYHLAAGSPAINSGMDLAGLISHDLDGNERPSFGGYVMGAYEFMEPSGSLRVLRWTETAK